MSSYRRPIFDEPQVGTHAAAAYLDVSPRTLEKMRHEGRGPAFLKISPRCVKYRLRDLDEWLKSMRRPPSNVPENRCACRSGPTERSQRRGVGGNERDNQNSNR